jgi:hypothetical protein
LEMTARNMATLCFGGADEKTLSSRSGLARAFGSNSSAKANSPVAAASKITVW